MKNLADATDIENVIEEKFSDIDNELKLIAYIVRKNYRTYYDIKKEFFSVDAFQWFYNLIKRYNCNFTKKIFLDIIKKESNKKEVERNLLYGKKIYETGLNGVNKDNVVSLIQEVKRLYEARFLMASIQKIVLDMDNFDLKKAKKILYPVFNIDRQTKNSRAEVLEDFENVYQKLQERKLLKKKSIIKTGIRKVDEVIGGINKGESFLIGGETGIGKSLFMEQIGINACYKQQANVVFVTLEMPVEMVLWRAYSNISEILFSKFRINNLNDKDILKWQKTIEAYRKKYTSFFEIVSFPRGSNINLIENYLYELQEERNSKVDFLIIDYLNLLDSSKQVSGGQKEHQNQSEASWEMQKLALNFNDGEGLAILTAGQLKDEAYGKEFVNLKHIKYSRAIAENINMCMAITKTEDNDFIDNEVTCSIIKSRSSAKVNPFQITVNYDYLKIQNHEEKSIGG